MADSKYDVIDIESQERRSIALKDLGDGTFALATADTGSTSSDDAGVFAIAPNDAADLANPVVSIIVGTFGALKWAGPDGNAVTTQVSSGQVFVPGCKIHRVYATGTTATNLQGVVQ